MHGSEIASVAVVLHGGADGASQVPETQGRQIHVRHPRQVSPEPRLHRGTRANPPGGTSVVRYTDRLWDLTLSFTKYRVHFCDKELEEARD